MAKTAVKNDKRPKSLPCGRPSAPKGEVQKGARLEEWKSKLEAYLTEKKLKNSEQRWKIAELILMTGGHLDAQTLVDRVKEQHPEIGAATVYRSIKLLQEASILKESLTDPSGRAVYEVLMDDDEHHDHIVCVDCGNIFEFHNDRIESLQNSIVREMDFAPIRHRHVIYVNCQYNKHNSR